MNTTKKEHYNVLITTPGFNMDARYLISLLATIKELESRGITWAYSTRANSDVAVARELTILGRNLQDLPKNFESPMGGLVTYDKIFLIDSDIMWEVDDFLKLYYSEYDAVTGIYMTADGTSTTIYERNDFVLKSVEATAKEHPFKIFGAGLGFMCIKSGIFEKIERPWFQNGIVKREISGNDKEYYVDIMSEDLSFMEKARKHGVEFWCDPGVLVGHVKRTVLHWYWTDPTAHFG